MKRIVAPKTGVRAHVCETVTVFSHKTGAMPFGKGACKRVKCLFYDIVINSGGGEVITRRVRKREKPKEAV